MLPEEVTTERDAKMLSRREFVALGAAITAAPSLTGCVTAGVTGNRALKDIVSTPTFDVEIHITDVELWTGTDVPDIRLVSDEAAIKAMQSMEWDTSIAGFAENLARYKDYQSRTSMDLRTEFLYTELDQAGIDIAIHQMVDHSAKPSSIGRYFRAGFDRMMEDSIRVRQKYGSRMISMVGIDPRSGEADAVRRFEIAIKDFGFKGLGEVVLQQFRMYPSDPQMYPLYEKCVEFSVPFVGNCEGPSPYTLPNTFEQVAKDFPDLKICLAGAGRPRNPGQSLEPITDAIRLASEYENIYLDTADWPRREKDGIELFLSFLRRCFDSDARGKVMYGSDFPVMTAMYHPRDWIDVVINRAGDYGFAFTDQEIRAFFSTNAMAFLEDVL